MNIKMKSRAYTGGLLIVVLCWLIPEQVIAHSRWIVPSHTILSGDTAEFISLDFSISNDIFHADVPYGGAVLTDKILEDKTSNRAGAGQALRANIMQKMFASTKILVTYPDGSRDDSLTLVNLGRKSASALQLRQSGTYRINVVQNPVIVTLYRQADGTPGREFGLLQDVKNLLPDGAKDIKTLRIHNRVETYVTRNDLTAESLQPAGRGLELAFDTHPNELFVGEPAGFRLLIDGKPAAAGIDIKLTRNDTRYRNARNALALKTKAHGAFDVTWTQSGLYLLEVEWETVANDGGIDAEVFALYATLEVNPQ